MYENSFYSDIKFYDDKNFPFGLSRSGDFTFNEAEVLTRCGVTLKKLIEGKMKPVNQAQERFLQVVEGKIEPRHFIEHTYLKYLKLVAKKNENLFAIKKIVPSDFILDELDVEFAVDDD